MNHQFLEQCVAHTRGTSPTWELSSGGRVPCSIGFPLYVSVLGTHLYQCTSWWCWERLHLASVKFFWRLSTHLPIPWWVIYERTCPHLNECSAVSDQYQPDPQAPPSLVTGSCTKGLFCLFVFLDEKSPQRKTLCWCGRSETKNGRSTKRHQNRRVQKLF